MSPRLALAGALLALAGCASPPGEPDRTPVMPPALVELPGAAAGIADLVSRSTPSVVRIQNEPHLFKPAGRYFTGLLEGLLGMLNPHPYWEWPYRVVAFPVYLLLGPFELGSTRGSAFFVGPDQLVTNAHVVENAALLRCELSDGRTARATVEHLDTERDLALLRLHELQGPRPRPLVLRGEGVRPGEPVVALGYPSRDMLAGPLVPASQDSALRPNPRVTIGVVSAREVELGNPLTRYVETDAALNPGSSGGPILGLDGNVVGVATMISVGKEDEGYAVPARTVLAAFEEFLDSSSDADEDEASAPDQEPNEQDG